MDNNIDICVSITLMYQSRNAVNNIHIVVSDSFLIRETKRVVICNYDFDPKEGVDYYVNKAIQHFKRIYKIT